MNVAKKKLKITVSIGVCSDTGLHEYVNEYIECADKKLYRAKREGKNRIVYK